MKQQRIPSLKILGLALRSARKKKGLTQTELAQQIGLKQKTVSGAENGSPGIQLATFFRILSGLELNLIIQENKKNDLNSGEW